MSTRRGLARGGRAIARTVAVLRARDGDGCGRCGGRIDFEVTGMNAEGPTIGHIVAAIAGGSDDLTNLRLEHRRCNLRAGSRTASPLPRYVKPVAIVGLLVATLAYGGVVRAITMADTEAALREHVLACSIIREAELRGISVRRMPATLASCRALR